jgi:hypothetical protein
VLGRRARHEDPVDGRHEVGGPVHLVEDQRQVGPLVGRVGREAERLHPGAAGLPVARVAPQLVDLVLEDPHLGEGAGGHRGLVGEGHRVGHPAPGVLRDDELGHHVLQAGDEGAGEGEVHPPLVHQLHRAQVGPDPRRSRAGKRRSS